MRRLHVSNDDLLARLRTLYEQHGRLSGPLITASTDVPSVETYRARFGSLFSAYRLVGFEPEPRNYNGLARAQLLAVQNTSPQPATALPDP